MMLKNKEGSDDKWILKMQNNSDGSITLSSKTDVLKSSGDGKVDLEKQLWKKEKPKGMPDAEDYFTLEMSNIPKFLTAISLEKTKTLQIQGNIPLKWIIPKLSKLLIIYYLSPFL